MVGWIVPWFEHTGSIGLCRLATVIKNPCEKRTCRERDGSAHAMHWHAIVKLSTLYNARPLGTP